jgi:hypothetical protein
MHSAPPVAYPLGRSSFQACGLLGFWLAGAAVWVLCAIFAPGLSWRLWLLAGAVLVAGCAAAWGWRHSPLGLLRWDAQCWHWESLAYKAGTPVLALSVALDFQRVLLLRLENQDHARLWLWAERSAMPERWLDLRRAVYAHHRLSPLSVDARLQLLSA